MSCADYTESLNALLDGEIAPAQAAPLAAHLATCPACNQTLAELAQLRAGLAQLVPEEVPAGLQARIEAAIAAEAPDNIVPLRRRRPALSGWLAAGALAAALMLALMPRHDVTKDLVSVHDAALRGGQSIQVASVPPAPSVPGFQLVASRTDMVAGHVAQVATYSKDGRTIVLCIWRANGEPAHGVKAANFRGMDIRYWNDGTYEYWAAGLSPDAGMKDFVTRLVPG